MLPSVRQAFLKCGVLTQYTVVYQCILAIGNHTAFFMDGTLFSNRQVNLCILISNSIGFCCCWSSASCARLPSIVSGRYSCISEMHMVYYLPAQLLPHTLAGSLTHSLTHPPTHSLTPSLLQVQVLDVLSMAMAIAACWMRPMPRLNRCKPQQRASGRYGLALVVTMAVCSQLGQIDSMAFLCTRPWFQGGNGSPNLVGILLGWHLPAMPESTCMMCTCCCTQIHEGAICCLHETSNQSSLQHAFMHVHVFCLTCMCLHDIFI